MKVSLTVSAVVLILLFLLISGIIGNMKHIALTILEAAELVKAMEEKYGVSAAARSFFGKSAARLTLPEAALLAGLPKAPGRYSPFLHFERGEKRRTAVR